MSIFVQTGGVAFGQKKRRKNGSKKWDDIVRPCRIGL